MSALVLTRVSRRGNPEPGCTRQKEKKTNTDEAPAMYRKSGFLHTHIGIELRDAGALYP